MIVPLNGTTYLGDDGAVARCSAETQLIPPFENVMPVDPTVAGVAEAGAAQKSETAAAMTAMARRRFM